MTEQATQPAQRAFLTSEILDEKALYALVDRPEAGAVCSFLGNVRNRNAGLDVTALEYHAYEEMAVHQMAKILSEIEAEIPDVQLACAHRVGMLQVGESAVIVMASSPHRDEAFKACRLGIDRIKAEVPIWKREYGPDGPYWVDWKDARCKGGHHHEHGQGHGHHHDLDHDHDHP